jgi:hypothetical protein
MKANVYSFSQIGITFNEKWEKVRKRITPILRWLETENASRIWTRIWHAPHPEQEHAPQVQVQVPPSPPLQPVILNIESWTVVDVRKSNRISKPPVFFAPPEAVEQVDLHVELFDSTLHGKGVRILVDADDGMHIMFMEGTFRKEQCKRRVYRNGESRNDFDSATEINGRLVEFS